MAPVDSTPLRDPAWEGFPGDSGRYPGSTGVPGPGLHYVLRILITRLLYTLFPP